MHDFIGSCRQAFDFLPRPLTRVERGQWGATATAIVRQCVVIFFLGPPSPCGVCVCVCPHEEEHRRRFLT